MGKFDANLFLLKKRRYHHHKLIALTCTCTVLSAFLNIGKKYSFGEAVYSAGSIFERCSSYGRSSHDVDVVRFCWVLHAICFQTCENSFIVMFCPVCLLLPVVDNHTP